MTPSVDYVEPFIPVQGTKETLHYADLVGLDLSKFDDGPEARVELAQELSHAMRTEGFFYVINHGLSQEEMKRQVDLSYHVLTKTPLEEKKKLEAQPKATGSYEGFKLRNYWNIDEGVKDEIEQYNFNRDMNLREHPSTFTSYRSEISRVTKHLHSVVLARLLTLFAISLDLPEDFFVKLHEYEDPSVSWFRYMMYFRNHSEADMKKTGGVWLKGHIDGGSLTLLFSQPMASLQLLDHNTKSWLWVPYIPGGIVVNAGEMMEWWTGGYYKATIHRVTQPPEDQRNQDRCGVFYFTAPTNGTRVNTLLDESSVLRKAKVPMRFEPDGAPAADLYCKARIGAYGVTDLFKIKAGTKVVEEVVCGVTVKHYN